MYGVKKKKPKFPYLNSSPTTCRPLNGKNNYHSIHNSHFYINLSITWSANSTFIEVIKQLLKLYNFITNGTNCLPSRPSCRLCLHRFPGANLAKHCQMFTPSKAKKSGCISFPPFCRIYSKRAQIQDYCHYPKWTETTISAWKSSP